VQVSRSGSSVLANNQKTEGRPRVSECYGSFACINRKNRESKKLFVIPNHDKAVEGW